MAKGHKGKGKGKTTKSRGGGSNSAQNVHASQKKERREAKRAMRQRKHDEDSGDFHSLKQQVATLNLRIKSIAGDGNCLFRSLGDQLDGDVSRHSHHRAAVVAFIRAHREDFEPFIEDDVSFDRHMETLAKDGTFAGNDAIVAFVRLHNIPVCIHQLNFPPWVVDAPTGDSPVMLHIAYSDGEHYSSIRRIDETGDGPSNIRVTSRQALGSERKKEEATVAAAVAARRDELMTSGSGASATAAARDDDSDDAVCRAVMASSASETARQEAEALEMAMAVSASSRSDHIDEGGESTSDDAMLEAALAMSLGLDQVETSTTDSGAEKRGGEVEACVLKPKELREVRKSARREKELAKMRRKAARLEEQRQHAAATATTTTTTAAALTRPSQAVPVQMPMTQEEQDAALAAVLAATAI